MIWFMNAGYQTSAVAAVAVVDTYRQFWNIHSDSGDQKEIVIVKLIMVGIMDMLKIKR